MELNLQLNNLFNLTIESHVGHLTHLEKINYKENYFSQLTISESSNYPMKIFLQETKLTQFPKETLLQFKNTLNYLQLQKNIIREIDHDLLVQFKNLHHLNLEFNEISTWPQTNQIQNSIEEIKLKYNEFTLLNLTYLSLFRKLRYISMSDNNFSFMEGNLDLPNLHTMYMYRQQLRSKGDFYSRMFNNIPNLNRFGMNYHLTRMPSYEEMTMIPRLTELNFGSNNISVLDLNIFEATPNIKASQIFHQNYRSWESSLGRE